MQGGRDYRRLGISPQAQCLPWRYQSGEWSVVARFVCSHHSQRQANMLVCIEDQQAKALLCDFGLAKIKETDSSGLTTSSFNLKGSSRYMSPELCLDPMRDFQSDIWAWGCVLLEVCCHGSRPKGPCSSSPRPRLPRISSHMRTSEMTMSSYVNSSPTSFRQESNPYCWMKTFDTC